MTTISARYQGDLKSKAIHTLSGSSLQTDEPSETQGKETSFSPTDLIATAVLTSMFTVMGRTAHNHSLSPGHISGKIMKTMAENPTRVSALEMEIKLQGHYLDDMGKKLLEAAALSCPVIRSIHPDIQLIVKFAYE